MPSDSSSIRIHQFQPASLSNGPGWRAVIWLQGCTLSCPGCYNPQTHSTNEGSWLKVDSLVEKVLELKGTIEGISISGGEPFQQKEALTAFLNQIRARSSLSVVVFSGFAWDEIQEMQGSGQILSNIDILLAGRYLAHQRLAKGLIGSRNKTVHFLTGRYAATDLEMVPEGEVILTRHGEIIFSGINPLNWAG